MGQHWGNPLFDWDALAARRLPLVDRAAAADVRAVDLAGSTTSAASPPSGRSRRARTIGRPHRPLAPRPRRVASSGAAEAELGPLPVIAEDLGVITKDVEVLRDALGFPGMVVLLWAFQGPAGNPHRLENHRVHQIVYTTTHDTRHAASDTSPDKEPWTLIELALSSRAAVSHDPAPRTCSASAARAA